jgi:hypothetical protein
LQAIRLSRSRHLVGLEALAAKSRHRDRQVALLESICFAVPRLLWNHTSARLEVWKLVTMKPTRGNNSPKWNSTFATTRVLLVQLDA